MVRSDKYLWKRRLAPYVKNPQVLGVILIAIVIPFTYYMVGQQTRTRQDAAGTGNLTAVGDMKLTATFNSIGIELPFSGDFNQNSMAILDFKKKNESNWRRGLPLWGTYPAFVPTGGELTTGDWVGEGAANAFFPLESNDDSRYTHTSTAGATHTFQLKLKQVGEFSPSDTATVALFGNTTGDDDVKVELLLNGNVIHSEVHNLTATDSLTTSQVTRIWDSTDIDNTLLRITHIQVGSAAEEVRLQMANVILEKYNNWTFYGSALLLDPNTEYDVRVTIEDPDGVATPTITGSIRTQADNVTASSSLTPTHFVSASGNDTTGTSISNAWKTLNRAFELAPAGAVIKVLQGSYDYPTIKRNLPITLIGDNAIIQPPYTIAKNSGAWDEVTFTGPVSGQQYKIWKASASIADPNMMQLESGAGLPEIVGAWNKTREASLGYSMLTPDAMTEVMYVNDMYRHGFFTFGNEIYVRLPGDRDPNAYTARFNKKAGYESGRVVLAGANSRVSGFTFNMVDLAMNSTADNLIIDNNKLINSTIFANANPSTSPNDYPENILIEKNDLRHTSLYSPARDHNAIPWRWIKGPFYINGQKLTWNRVGDEHEVTAIGGRGGVKRMVIRNNYIEGYFNGFGAQSKGFDRYLKSEYDIYNNTIRWIADDIFEPDGGGMNWRVWNNKASQSAITFSFGPAYWGPAYIFRNSFVDMGHDGVGKIVSTTDTDIGIGTLWFKYSGASTPPLMAYVVGNTYQSTNTKAMGGMASAGGGGTPEHFYLRNNLFSGSRYTFALKNNVPGQRMRWDEDYNAWTTTDLERGFEVDGKDTGTLERYRERTGQGVHSNPHGSLHDPISLNTNYTLPNGSPLINAGTPVPNIFDNYDAQSSYIGSAPDMGTCEFGGECFVAGGGPGDPIVTTPTQTPLTPTPTTTSVSPTPITGDPTPPIGGTSQTTTLALSPATASKTTGTTTTTNVTINTQNSVTNADLALTFNPAVMEVTAVTLGGFLPQAREVEKTIDNTTGKVLYSFYTDSANAKSGSGTIAKVTWRAKSAGTSTLAFDPATTIVYGTGTGNTIASGGLSSATYTVTGTTVPTATPTVAVSTPVPPTATNTVAPTVVGDPACAIGTASWNLSSVDEGTLVTLRATVTGVNCAGKQVTFKVRENDSLLEGGLDEDANTQPAAAVVSGFTATTTWIAEWQNDCNGLCNSPEYYFNATLAGGNTVRSADPLLSVQKTESAVTLKLTLPYLSESQDLLNSTVTIRNTQTNQDVSKTVTLVPGTNNTYTATLQTVLTPGEYAMVVKRHQFLAKRFTFTVGSTAPNLDFSSTPLVGGDINNDNVINTLDLGKVIEEYSPQQDTTATSDLTRDKRINALDLGVVIENYFKQGESL